MLLPTEILIKKLALITTDTRPARVQRDASRATTAGMREKGSPGEKLDKCILINASSAFPRSCVACRDEECPNDKRIPVSRCSLAANTADFHLISSFPSHAADYNIIYICVLYAQSIFNRMIINNILKIVLQHYIHKYVIIYNLLICWYSFLFKSILYSSKPFFRDQFNQFSFNFYLKEFRNLYLFVTKLRKGTSL